VANPFAGNRFDPFNIREIIMRNVVTLVLGGGQGTRLYPLTKYRSKPAVPIAGKIGSSTSPCRIASTAD
jgi:hypothetical protein